MIKQNEEIEGMGVETNIRLIPDIVLEHAKKIEMNDWRHSG